MLCHPFVVLSLAGLEQRGWWCHLGLPCTAHGARPLAEEFPGLSHPLLEPSHPAVTLAGPWSAEEEFLKLIQDTSPHCTGTDGHLPLRWAWAALQQGQVPPIC